MLQVCAESEDGGAAVIGVLSAASGVETLKLDVFINSRMGLRLVGADSAGAVVHIVGYEPVVENPDSDDECDDEGMSFPPGLTDMDMMLAGTDSDDDDFSSGDGSDDDEGEDGEQKMKPAHAEQNGSAKNDPVGNGKLVPKSGVSTIPVKTLKSGLKFQDMVVGKGKPVRQGHNVALQYVLRLENGKVIDKTDRKRPFKFRLGIGECVKGFDIGVDGMREGGERYLIVPPKLGYGSSPPPGIPKNSVLYFDVTVVKAW